MKTTVELPDELMRALKQKAANESKKLKDVMEETIRRGLEQPGQHQRPLIVKDPNTGLPLILSTLPGSIESPDISQILLDQEVEWYGRTP